MKMTGQRGFHMMAKPMGPICNLNCKYCFYLEKNELFDHNEKFLMNDEVLEAYIKKYINSQSIPEISFVWQGGEPMLAGLDFYKKAINLQKKYAGEKKIINSIQTNGTLLDDEWCAFLKENGFLVGISLDGPVFFHDKYRVNRQGNSTFYEVVAGIELLKKYQIEFNVLMCVTKESVRYGKRIYQFFKHMGVRHIQFTPLVERVPDEQAMKMNLNYALTPVAGEGKLSEVVTSFSVEPIAYGEFLVEVFDQWVKNDVGKTFISNIEVVLPAWMGLGATMCTYAEKCGESVIIEHNGDIYSCDHFMYPSYRLGNILTDDPMQLVKSKQQMEFGEVKNKKLSEKCRNCEVLFACRGGCPKQRFVQYQGDNLPTNYLCEGYKKYYTHIHRYMKAMVQLIENGLPASKVMELQKGPIMIFND